jgi:uncharacterized protein YjiK
LFDSKNSIEFEKINTPLSLKNDVEGLCYDNIENSLLLACKDYPGKGFKKLKAVYEFNLTKMEFLKEPRFLISLKDLNKNFDIKDFSPSGIEKNPINGNFFIISANPEAIIEINSSGKILNAQNLNDEKHMQPEGITFLDDGTLILADESNQKKAKLTIIPYKE